MAKYTSKQEQWRELSMRLHDDADACPHQAALLRRAAICLIDAAADLDRQVEAITRNLYDEEG